MQTVQAVGTMISVIGSGAAGRDEPSAVFACKAFFAGMGLIIAFFVFFSFIIPIHWVNLQKVNDHDILLGGLASLCSNLPVRSQLPAA